VPELISLTRREGPKWKVKLGGSGSPEFKGNCRGGDFGGGLPLVLGGLRKKRERGQETVLNALSNDMNKRRNAREDGQRERKGGNAGQRGGSSRSPIGGNRDGGEKSHTVPDIRGGKMGAEKGKRTWS